MNGPSVGRGAGDVKGSETAGRGAAVRGGWASGGRRIFILPNMFPSFIEISEAIPPPFQGYEGGWPGDGAKSLIPLGKNGRLHPSVGGVLYVHGERDQPKPPEPDGIRI